MALAFLAATLVWREGARGVVRDCIVHVKGRVSTSLPLDGSLGRCGEVGIRWPGTGGDEYLGSGGLFFRFVNAAGERVEPGTFEAVPFDSGEFFDGCARGKRFPHPLRDDDGDGLVNEDPIDGIDNDRDGFIDEDFAAIGDEMLVTVAIDRETGLVRKQRSYTWTFGHVRDFIGFTTSIKYPQGTTDFLRNLETVLYADFDIGDENLSSRGVNDHFFVIEKEWEGGTLHLHAARDGERFVALLLLDAVGPRGEELGVETLLLRSTETPWEPRDLMDGDGASGRLRADTQPDQVPPPAAEEEPSPERTRTGSGTGMIDGDGAIACRLEKLPEFWPGDELTVHWAIIFGASENRLIRNALRALETYEGVPDGEGTFHRWIVPARRAARIELEAQPAFVWSRGCRQPAATIALPPSLEEEVEWLRGLNAATLEYQQVEDKIIVTIDGPIDVGTIFIEGQLTDGTIFTTTLRSETLIGTQDENQPGDGLPDDSIQLYPNPFLTSLNINLRVFDSALTEEAAGSSSVRIYDVRGRLVRTVLEQGPLHPGDYQRTWDGLDEHGNEAVPGVYYVKLQIGERSATKRVILLR